MPDSRPEDPAAGAQPFDATDLLRQVWQQNEHIMRARVERLEYAAACARKGPLPEELRVEAADLAHKLAGSLGMFGYPEGTLAAQQIETMLDPAGALVAEAFLEQVRRLRAAVPL